MKGSNHPFVNTALDFCIYNLHTLEGSPEAHKRVFNLLKNESFEEFGIAGKQRDYFYVYPQSRYDDFARIHHQRTKNTCRPATTERSSACVPVQNRTAENHSPSRSVFEKSKRDLNKELQSVKRQLNSLEEQNKDLADKLTVCLEELQKQNGAFRADGR